MSFRTQTDYRYMHAWHTLYDLYSELVPYTEHQQHSAMVTAVVAFGAANLDKPLPREGVYLADGLYADIAIGAPDSTLHIMTALDFVHAPLQTANFVRIVEGNTPGQRRGGPRMGGRPRQDVPPIGKIDVRGGLVTGLVESEVQKSVAVAEIPLAANPGLKHEAVGILGLSGPNTFYLTLQKRPELNRKTTAIGRTIAGLDLLKNVKRGDAIRSIRIVRVGQAARDFKTDDEAFRKLLEGEK